MARYLSSASIAAVVLLMAALTHAHGGGLNSDGCHNDNVNGGYHCHHGYGDHDHSTHIVMPSRSNSQESNNPNRSKSDHASYTGTHCGRSGAENPAPRWHSYRCQNSTTEGCLSRSEYTTERGRGCPGEQMCCPAPVRRAAVITPSPRNTVPTEPPSSAGSSTEPESEDSGGGGAGVVVLLVALALAARAGRKRWHWG